MDLHLKLRDQLRNDRLLGIRSVSKLDDSGSIGKTVAHALKNLVGKARLTYSAHTGQRHKRLMQDHLNDIANLPLAPDKAGQETDRFERCPARRLLRLLGGPQNLENPLEGPVLSAPNFPSRE